MKFIILMLLSTQSFALTEKAVCKKLTAEAEKSCVEQMCEDFRNESECRNASDFMEGFQVCVDDELSALIENYNKKNPKKPVSCEE